MRHQKTYFVLLCFLVGILTLSNIPVYLSEDANLDRRVDLKDAVLHLQRTDFVNIGDEQKAESSAECLKILQTISGDAGIVSNVISPEDQQNATLCFLIAGFHEMHLQMPDQYLTDKTIFYQSVEYPPLCDPPIMTLQYCVQGV